jgi:hypothetical protein
MILAIPPARDAASYAAQARAALAFATKGLPTMLDGNERCDCESQVARSIRAVGAKDEDLRV